MREALMLALAAVVSLAGFCVLALGQERHWQVVTGRDKHARLPGGRLRAAGLAAQASSCALFVLAQGPGFGPLLWATSMTGVAMLVAFALTWRPQWLRPVARVLTVRSKLKAG